MSVNGISFGCVPCKKFYAVASEFKMPAEKLTARIDKPVLKSKDGYLISTREECEAFIKWIEENGNETEKKLLKTARYNLIHLKEMARKLLTSSPNDPFKSLMPNTANLMKRAYGSIGPENICREYVRLQENAIIEAQRSRHSSMTKTNIFASPGKSKYSPMYSKYCYNA